MKPRHGFSLVEVIGALTMGSVVMGIVVALMTLLLQTEGATRGHVHRSTVLARLGEQFRCDTRAAKTTAAGQIAGEIAATWQFTLVPGHVITYRPESGRLVRLETDGQGTQRREAFTLPPETTARIEIPEQPTARIVSLLIIPAADASARTSKRIIRFDAMLASDHRFATSEASSSENEDEGPSNEDADGQP